ncbi:DNA polymerase/3'-5' exonuclease PolX [soil metagenome]
MRFDIRQDEQEFDQAMRNADIAELFREMAELLELEDANPFRVRAYRTAAATVEELSTPVSQLIEDGADLTELRGIGDDLAASLREIVATGSFEDLDTLRESSTATLRALLQIPGLGPKRVQALHAHLGIASIEDLERSLASGEIDDVPGFGRKTIQNLQETLLAGRRKKERRLWADVEGEALALEEFIQGIEGAEQGRVGGSFRRRRETVADLDVVVSSSSPDGVIGRFVEYGQIGRILSQGSTRASVLLESGLPVDLRVVEPESWGSALMYFTGSRDHQLRLRDMAIDNGWKLNEYGLFDGDERLAGSTEEEVYRQFGLEYIEPELRESRGEIDAARSGKLPELVALEDLRGDAHVYSSSGGGRQDIRSLAQAASERGYGYFVIADRVSEDQAKDALTLERLCDLCEEIARINDDLGSVTLLAGAEIDVLEDGSPAIDPADLGELDLIIWNIAGNRDLSREKQTTRLLRALDHPACQALAHLTGRIVNEREPADFDVERVLSAARDAACAIEIDGNPRRLDLPDRYCQIARDIGTKLIVTSRADRIEDLGHIRHAVDQARRGWLESRDVLNTRSVNDFLSGVRSG